MGELRRGLNSLNSDTVIVSAEWSVAMILFLLNDIRTKTSQNIVKKEEKITEKIDQIKSPSFFIWYARYS